MEPVLNYLKGMISLLQRFTPSNLLEVVIIACVLYEILKLIRNSHAFSVLKGVVVILFFTLLAAVLRLNNILWILERVSATAVIALVVIFQPELRSALETLGKQKIVSRLVSLSGSADESSGLTEHTVSEIVKGVFEMAKVKTGALIVIRQEEDLLKYLESGIMVDGIVSSALLINTFEKNTPLHDGAAILSGSRMLAATCYLPLSENHEISKDLGTRHRAALGMSEATDSVIIVVSEETGHVSLAHDGVLTPIQDAKELRDRLLSLHTESTEKNEKKKQHEEN